MTSVRKYVSKHFNVILPVTAVVCLWGASTVFLDPIADKQRKEKRDTLVSLFKQSQACGNEASDPPVPDDSSIRAMNIDLVNSISQRPVNVCWTSPADLEQKFSNPAKEDKRFRLTALFDAKKGILYIVNEKITGLAIHNQLVGTPSGDIRQIDLFSYEAAGAAFTRIKAENQTSFRVFSPSNYSDNPVYAESVIVPFDQTLTAER